MTRTGRVVSLASLTCGVAFLLGVFAQPTYAGTLSSTYNASLTGVSGTTVQASFTFNTTTDVFGGTLNFSGGTVFNGVTDNFNQAAPCIAGLCALALTANVNGNTLVYTVTLNTKSNKYSAAGTITNRKGVGAWTYSGNATGQVSVAENWGLAESLGFFILVLLTFGLLTRLGLLRTIAPSAIPSPSASQ